MDLLLLLKAAMMGLVEGITEFLPISSTGHLILTGQLLDFWSIEKRDMFSVAVQIGAIAAVIYEYWGKLWGALIGALTGQEQGRRLSLNLIIASIPIVIIGLTFGEVVKAYLFNAITVAIALIIGGFIILWAERRQHQVVSHEVEDLTFKQATLIGLIQCFALIPGTSRSGSTIIGSLFSIMLVQLTAKLFVFVLLVAYPIGKIVPEPHQSMKQNTAHLQFPMQATSCKNLSLKEIKNGEYHTPPKRAMRVIGF